MSGLLKSCSLVDWDPGGIHSVRNVKTDSWYDPRAMSYSNGRRAAETSVYCT